MRGALPWRDTSGGGRRGECGSRACSSCASVAPPGPGRGGGKSARMSQPSSRDARPQLASPLNATSRLIIVSATTFEWTFDPPRRRSWALGGRECWERCRSGSSAGGQGGFDAAMVAMRSKQRPAAMLYCSRVLQTGGFRLPARPSAQKAQRGAFCHTPAGVRRACGAFQNHVAPRTRSDAKCLVAIRETLSDAKFSRWMIQ